MAVGTCAAEGRVPVVGASGSRAGMIEWGYSRETEERVDTGLAYLLARSHKLLAADPQAVCQGQIAYGILLLEVGEMSAPLAYKLQQPPPGRFVMGMASQVLG